MEQIIIAGRTLDELKQIQQEVRKDANKFIAQFIEAGESAVKEILSLVEEDAEEVSDEIKDKVTELSVVAEKHLAQAKLISDISGVSYYLPYREHGYGESYYNDLENRYDGLPDNDAVSALFSILEDMESESRDWHSSSKYC